MNNTALYCEGPLKRGLLWKHLRTCVCVEVSLPGSQTLIYFWNNCLDSLQKRHSCLHFQNICICLHGVFVAAQGLSLAVGEHGLLSVCGARVLTVAASLVVEHRF